MAFLIPEAAFSAFFLASPLGIRQHGNQHFTQSAGKPFEQIGISLRRGLASFGIERSGADASALCVFDA